MTTDDAKHHSSTDTGGDYVLSVIAAVADKDPSFSMGITFTISGATITGKLVGRRTWFAAWKDIEPTIGGAMHSAADEGLEKKEDEGTPLHYEFLHLVEARVLTGQGLFPSNGGMWRGRIAKVSGFMLGEMSGTHS